MILWDPAPLNLHTIRGFFTAVRKSVLAYTAVFLGQLSGYAGPKQMMAGLGVL